MSRLFLLLSLVMGAVVLASNYLVQFPINHYGLEEILTYGALSYPIAFLITDLANRSYGKVVARNIVYIGFAIGISFTLLLSTNFGDLISVRIAIGSGTAFLVAQLLDVQRSLEPTWRLWDMAIVGPDSHPLFVLHTLHRKPHTHTGVCARRLLLETSYPCMSVLFITIYMQ